MERVDYLVVGTGLTGATLARLLHDAGREVLVLERRAHIGGNIHDHVHASGIHVHTYGPHYFRTDSEAIWRFVNRFSPFFPYEACIKSWVDGRYENWPVAASYIARTIGRTWSPAFAGKPTNFEEASLAMMPRAIYEKFVKGYTEKQWGVPARTLSARLAGRFDVRVDDEPRLKICAYQGIPCIGYTGLVQKMLEGIPVHTSVDYLKDRLAFSPRERLIFTGAIDEFFGYELGRLTYRGQRREHTYCSSTGHLQPCGQVNNPQPENGPHIRALEWKHMMPPAAAARIAGTLITLETPFTPSDPNDYEYPFPDDQNTALYERYRSRAAGIPGLTICGRLGEYRYYDMDQAIACAMRLATHIVKRAAA